MSEMNHYQFVMRELSRAEGSQTAFASAIGVKPQNVNNWIHDVAKPPMKMIEHISDYYGLSIDGLTQNSDRFLAELSQLEDAGVFPTSDSVFDSLREKVSNSVFDYSVIDTGSMPKAVADSYSKLNKAGRKKVAEYIDDLLGNSKYTD